MPNNKYGELAGFADEIRAEVQPLAKQEGKEYDPNKWEKAPADVRLGLGNRWIDRAATKFGKEPDELRSSIFRSLGVTIDSSMDMDAVVERIKEFQRDHGGLEVDGIIGPKTLEAMDNATEGTFDKPLTNKEGTPYAPIGAPAEGLPEGEDMVMQEGGDQQALSPKEQRQAARRKARQEAKEALREGEKRQDTIADAVLATNAELEKADQDVGAKEVDFKTKEEEKKSAGEAEVKATQDAEKAKEELVQAEVELSNKTAKIGEMQEAHDKAKASGDATEISITETLLGAAKKAQAEAAAEKVAAEEKSGLAEAGKQAAISKHAEATKKAEDAQKELDTANKRYTDLSTKKGQLEADLSKAALEQRQAEIAAEKPRTPEPVVEEGTEEDMPVAEPVADEETTDSEETADVPQEAEQETEEVDETVPATDEAPAPAAPAPAPTPEEPDVPAPAPAPAPVTPGQGR